MIDLEKITKAYSGRILFIEEGKPVTYDEFSGQVRSDERLTGAAEGAIPELVSLSLAWDAQSLARLFRCWSRGQSVFLGDAATEADLSPFSGHGPLLILQTGGTTGTPKHVVHSVRRFLSRYRIEPRPGRRILPLYAADHVAGLDALFQALHRGSTLVLPRERSAREISRCLERDRVEVLPATPTFLQFLILSGELENSDTSSVEIIPHGAEPMPDALRKRIREFFPNARLVQRFGLTELGALPVSADLEDPDALRLQETEGMAWRIEDGQLFIKSPWRMLGTLEDGPVDPGNAWHATGDLAEMTENGSLRLLGRREFLINVGGMKVIPERVESLLLEQPSVRDATVYSQPNPMTGEAVCADVVYAGDPDPVALLGLLRRAARQAGLSLAYVPTRIQPVSSIGKSRIGKRLRTRVKT